MVAEILLMYYKYLPSWYKDYHQGMSDTGWETPEKNVHVCINALYNLPLCSGHLKITKLLGLNWLFIYTFTVFDTS